MNRLTARVLLMMLVLTSLSNFASAEIKWQRSPEAVLRSARTSGRPILVFVSAQWCHYCTKMKKETWSNPLVEQSVSQHFETLVLDGDRDDNIVRKLGLRGFPATLLYTPDGRFIEQKGGFMPPQKTLAW
ncbi:MAG: thioredoxin family protein, partial [Planctomycetota bacterium]